MTDAWGSSWGATSAWGGSWAIAAAAGGGGISIRKPKRMAAGTHTRITKSKHDRLKRIREEEEIVLLL